MSYNPTRLTGLLCLVFGATVAWVLHPPEVSPIAQSQADIVDKFDDAVSAALAITRTTDELEKQRKELKSLELRVQQLAALSKIAEVPQVLPQVPVAESEPLPVIRRFRR